MNSSDKVLDFSKGSFTSIKQTLKNIFEEAFKHSTYLVIISKDTVNNKLTDPSVFNRAEVFELFHTPGYKFEDIVNVYPVNQFYQKIAYLNKDYQETGNLFTLIAPEN